MLQIHKFEPAFFTAFIRDEDPKNWDDIAPIREYLRRHLLETEQNLQCAYTEIRINEDSSSSHIDHFKRKHTTLFPELKFVYSNLFAASQLDDFGARYKDRQVKTAADYSELLGPLTPDLSSQFEYNIETGEIEGKTDKAKYTMEVFNLNHDTLLSRRKAAAKFALSYIDQFDLENTIELIGEFESLIRYIYTVN